MALVSVTRLRIRRWRFMMPFAIYSLRAARQAQRSPGFIGGWLGPSGSRAFWTVTVWTDEAAMKRYRDNGAHKAAMSKMLGWADEGAMARYEQPGTEPPSGPDALQALQSRGRISKVRHPTAEHSAGKTAPDGKAPIVGRVLTPKSRPM
jgi:hypothetical protein